jgi:hypothetical protein
MEFSGVRNSWLMFERKRDFISSARRRWSARSSSSAYSATTPRLVSSSSRLTRTSSSWRVRRSASAASSSRFCRCSSASGSSGRSWVSSRLSRSRAAGVRVAVPGGRSFRSDTAVPCADVSTWNRSTSRRAPTSPSPMPVGDSYSFRRIRSSCRIPGPRSVTRTRRIWGEVRPSSTKSTWPPFAYSKALRAISDVAVARRVWSCTSNPRSRAMVRARCRARTTSPSRRIGTDRRGRLMTAGSPPRR